MQVHKFVAGMAPIRSVVRLGSAFTGLLATPALLRRETLRAGSAGGTADGRLGRALRRSTASFARALVFEALGLGASVAAGAPLPPRDGAQLPICGALLLCMPV